MEIFVARQPIIDRTKNLIGYELLFRDGHNNAFPNIDAVEATSKLLTGSHFNLGIESFTGHHKAFINFPELSVLVRVPEILPKEQVVIELLEDIRPTKELKCVCQALVEQGYTIALDDFAYKEEWRPILPYVQIIKVDIQQSSARDIFELKKLKLEYEFELLAEKVETYHEYQKMMDMGFSYFQGYFFARPEIIEKRGLSPSKLNLLQLLSLVAQAKCDFNEIESVLNKDVSLVYKLLRLVNSAAFGLQKEVNSIKQALVYLGESKLKRFLALLITANLADQKPLELTRLALTRARFAEMLAREVDESYAAPAFLVGLLSLIDAILDEEMKVILSKLPLIQSINQSLIAREGPLAEFLRLIEHYERARWPELERSLKRTAINQAVVPKLYAQATDWCSQIINSGSGHDPSAE